MFHFKSVTIFDLAKPIFYANKCFGNFPFSFNVVERDVKISYFDVLQICVLITFWCFHYYLQFTSENALQDNGSEFAALGARFGNSFGVLIVVGTILVNLMHREKLLKILVDLDKFDQQVLINENKLA